MSHQGRVTPPIAAQTASISGYPTIDPAGYPAAAAASTHAFCFGLKIIV
jgi:hypothetical protein